MEFGENEASKKADPVLPSGFEGLEMLGAGAHGAVYKSRYLLLERTVAVKVINNDGSSDMQKQISRIQKEAKILSRLSHENIVKVFQVGVCDDGRPYLVCEYLEGITLEEKLAQSGKLSYEEILLIIPPVLDALQFAHENQILHRDIKPSNILLKSESDLSSFQVKLLDFGIAREIENSTQNDSGLTQSSMLSGSPAYMSPEQCQGTALDRTSDIYSLACVVHKCIFGELPFTGESVLAMQYMHLHKSAADLETLRSLHNQPGLQDLLLRSLSKDPAERPQTAEEFKELLQRALVKKSKRNLGLVVLSVSALLLALFAGFGFVLHNKIHEQAIKQSRHYEKSKDTDKNRVQSNSTRGSFKTRLTALIKKYEHLIAVEQLVEDERALEVLLKECNKKDKESYFALTLLKARFLDAKDSEKIEERKMLLMDALSCCKTPDGKEDYEAVYSYVLLAKIETDQKRKEEFLKRADDLLRSNNSSVYPEQLLKDSGLRKVLFKNLDSRFYHEMAELEYSRKNYLKAVALYKKEEYTIKTYNDLPTSVGPGLTAATILLQQNEATKAFAIMNEIERELDNFESKDVLRESRRTAAYIDVAKWWYKNSRQAEHPETRRVLKKALQKVKVKGSGFDENSTEALRKFLSDIEIYLKDLDERSQINWRRT